MILHRERPRTTFDTRTGILVRSGNEKPAAPELIDLKVTNRCHAGCSICYMNSQPGGEHANLDWITRQIETLPEFPFEIALGGGEPSEWPHLEAFVDWCRYRGVCCNAAFGPACNLEVLHRVTRQGMMSAVGLSYTGGRMGLSRMSEAARGGGARVVAHVILDASQIEEVIASRRFLEGCVQGVTFLLFKPHGRGDGQWGRVPTREQMRTVWDAYRGFPGLGFDSCCLPAFKGLVPDLLVDPCDGGKYSLFLDAVGRTCSPCSFHPAQFDLDRPRTVRREPWNADLPPTLGMAWSWMDRTQGCRYLFGGRGKTECA